MTATAKASAMKVICDRAALLESLNLFSGLTPSRTPKPVLSCIRLETGENTLTLSATDMEVAVKFTTPRVEVTESGITLVPADKLSQIVRESVDPTLVIESEGEETIIRSQDARFKLLGYNQSEFPTLPEFEGEVDFDISAENLHKLVSQTIFATARENSRYAINGVLFDRQGNNLSVVATDGHRLAIANGKCHGNSDHSTAIVPSKALNLLLKLFTNGDEPVRIKVADGKILFATETALLASNLVEGNFPPYKDVIPKDGDKRATLGTDTLISAFRRAALLTNEECKGVKMSFADKNLTLSSRAPEMGEATINIACPEYAGEDVEIGFNPHYVLDALKVVEDEKVTFEFKAGNKPGVLRTGKHFMYVIMPVNLS